MVAEDDALGYKQSELRAAFQPMIDLRKQEEEETKKKNIGEKIEGKKRKHRENYRNTN